MGYLNRLKRQLQYGQIIAYSRNNTPRTFAKIGISHGHQALVYTFPANNSGRINSELLNAAHKEFKRKDQVPTRAWCEERGMDKSCSYKVIEQLLLNYR